MTCYPVYLEIAVDGRCLAHAPGLPGCVLRAATREEALRGLPQAIRDHYAWLRRHGEPALPADVLVEVEVAGESIGFGPFDPGDAAALLPPDRKPVSPEEMERYFRLMAYSRADLLALVQHLPDDVLDWQPDPGTFSLRRLLRHIGNAEEWYVSRLAPPETLPPEWEDDESLPLFAFLEMERRTAVARLCQLTEAERSGVFHPACWTDHPEEAWTARKALRRALEHERQHTVQARRILAAYRNSLLARLAAGRAGLLQRLLGLDEQILTSRTVHGDWTVKDILAHVAAWDRWEARAMQCMVAGEVPDLTAVQDFDAANAVFVALWRDRTLAEVLLELKAARSDWVGWLERLPEEEFYKPRSYEGWDWTFSTVPLRVQWEHDAAHAQRIAGWRASEGLEGKAGPGLVLLAALAAAREELLAATALVPAEVRASRPVCGVWTLKDVVGHIADWEWLGADGLRQMAAGQTPRIEHVTDIDTWNQSHVEARRDQPWGVVWSDFQVARRALRGILEGMNQSDLARLFPFPWGTEGTPYEWVCVYVDHDRSHAQRLCAASDSALHERICATET